MHVLTRRMARNATMALGLSVALLMSPGPSGIRPGVRAQEATPEAVMPVLTGTLGFKTYANFGSVEATTLHSVPVGVKIFQLELAPGASVVYPPGDPGMGAHLVESGTLTLRAVSTDIMVTRADTQSGHAPRPAVSLPAGSEMRVQPGDGFLLPPLAAGEFRNDGTELVVLAISVLVPVSDTADSGGATPAT